METPDVQNPEESEGVHGAECFMVQALSEQFTYSQHMRGLVAILSVTSISFLQFTFSNSLVMFSLICICFIYIYATYGKINYQMHIG